MPATTSAQMLQEKINASGLKKNFILKQLHLSYQGFDNKMYGRREWTAREVTTLCDILNITSPEERQAIFLPDM